MDPVTSKRPGETVFGWLLLLLSVFTLYAAHGISGFSGLATAGAFPMAAAAVMVVCAAMTVARDARRPAADRGLKAFADAIAPPALSVFFAMICVFAVLLDRVGFLIAAFLFLFASIRFLQRRGTGQALALAVGSLVLVWVVFRLVFQVILPEGIVPEREMISAVRDMLSGGTQ